MTRLRIEFWWLMERWAGKLWQLLCADRTTYWLDWLPAFMYRQRKNAELEQYRRSAS